MSEKKLQKSYELFKSRVEDFKSKKILIMLSGGVDSMLLVEFFLKVKEEFKINIGCFHLNHQYRGLDADMDAKFVQEYCEKNNIISHIESKNIPKIAKENKESFELCARKIRLSLAINLKKEFQYDYIATAHHLDDSIESIVHNFIRGAGISGLVGINFINNCFIRPFIDITKSDITQIAEFLNIEYRQDESNYDTDFTRNLIRHKIVPQFLKINPSFKQTIKNTSKQIEEDKNYLIDVAKKSLEEINLHKNALNHQKMDIISLDLLKFRSLNIAIKKRVIRLIIEDLKGDLTDVYSSIIDEIINLSDNDNSGKHIIYKDIIFEISRDSFVISKVQKNRDLELDLSLGKNKYKDLIIDLSIVDYNYLADFEKLTNRDNYMILPQDYIEKKLILRHRKNGDYIRSERLKGHSKSLKKLFVDLKLSNIEKDRQVILSSEDEVLWILGLEKKYFDKRLLEEKNVKFLLIQILSLR